MYMYFIHSFFNDIINRIFSIHNTNKCNVHKSTHHFNIEYQNSHWVRMQ